MAEPALPAATEILTYWILTTCTETAASTESKAYTPIRFIGRSFLVICVETITAFFAATATGKHGLIVFEDG
jgi:hypothetical protein